MTLGDEQGDRSRRRCARRWDARRGLERRLHDGPALRLSALSLRLGVLRAEAPAGAPLDGLDAVQDELGAVLQELRGVAGALYPPLLAEAGLGPALRELVAATGAGVRVDADDVRGGTAAEGAAYFAVAACVARGDVAEVRVRAGGAADRRDLVVTLAGVDPGAGEVLLDEAAPLGGEVVTDTATTTDPTGAARATITARFPCV